jgi:hypothetical protein
MAEPENPVLVELRGLRCDVAMLENQQTFARQQVELVEILEEIRREVAAVRSDVVLVERRESYFERQARGEGERTMGKRGEQPAGARASEGAAAVALRPSRDGLLAQTVNPVSSPIKHRSRFRRSIP